MKNIDKYKDYLLLKNLSINTVNIYLSNIRNVSKKIDKDIDDITEYDLAKYVLNDGFRLSSSTQRLIINSFASYFKIIHNRAFDFNVLPRPKIEQKQPDVLSEQEIQSILDVTCNLKHKTVFVLMYSGALRVSEVINLKIKDIDSSNNKINIRQAKGKIDRFIPLSDKLLYQLRRYYKEYRMSEYVFEGINGKKYSSASIRFALSRAVKKTQISKRINTHSFRHSSITNMIKNGVNIRVVQKIAGHKNINTTANYIKIFNADIMDAINPLENIQL